MSLHPELIVEKLDLPPVHMIVKQSSELVDVVAGFDKAMKMRQHLVKLQSFLSSDQPNVLSLCECLPTQKSV